MITWINTIVKKSVAIATSLDEIVFQPELHIGSIVPGHVTLELL